MSTIVGGSAYDRRHNRRVPWYRLATGIGAFALLWAIYHLCLILWALMGAWSLVPLGALALVVGIVVWLVVEFFRNSDKMEQDYEHPNTTLR